MKSVPKLIRRSIRILLLGCICVFGFNLLLLIYVGYRSTSGYGPWTTADETAAALIRTESGYVLPDAMAESLKERGIWAVFVDNDTGNVIWHTDGLPPEVPTHYALNEVAALSRGYVKDYPTFTSNYENGLVILGFPPKSYWKLLNNSWNYGLIEDAPKLFVSFAAGNILVIFLLYMGANTKMFRSIRPILEGIEALPKEQDIHLQETGSLSEIAACVNRTSEMLRSKNYALRRKEMARANWISGVSHDIRTPLSMVMGYAGQLEDDPLLPEDTRKKARIIRLQSVRMKNLINDLNLSSKLEYNMQPLQCQKLNAVAFARQAVVDFLNQDPDGKYPICWETSEDFTCCFIQADEPLLKRAVQNLLLNCQSHNPDGCRIHVSVSRRDDCCQIFIEDDGIGISDVELNRIRTTPHYMMCDSSAGEQRHGLGLLIVQQIVLAHHGQTLIQHGRKGGFAVCLVLPVDG